MNVGKFATVVDFQNVFVEPVASYFVEEEHFIWPIKQGMFDFFGHE